MRGLYSGGTFCYEALLLLSEALGPIASNTPLEPGCRLADVWHSRGHTAIDLGDDVFTRGRPHPMIDQTLRIERLQKEAADPEVAVILFDVVLGHGAQRRPGGRARPALRTAQAAAASAGRQVAFVGSVCGTAADPQDLGRQEAALRTAGVLLAEEQCPGGPARGQDRGRRLGLRALLMPALFAEKLEVVNVGLPAFAAAIRAAGGSAIEVEWQPPGQGDPAVAQKLAGLINEPRIETANRDAFAAYLAAEAGAAEGIGPARDHVPGLGARMIFHAGPPIAWARMCGPVRGAIVGATCSKAGPRTPKRRMSSQASGGSFSRPAIIMAPSGRWPA